MNNSGRQLVDSVPCHKAFLQFGEARGMLLNLLSGIYALVLVIMAFAFQFAVVLLGRGGHYAYFYLFLYIGALVYLGYCELFLFRNGIRKNYASIDGNQSSWFRRFSQQPQQRTQEHGGLTSTFLSDTKLHESVAHSAPPAGSMFLKLGAVAFGVTWVIRNSTEFIIQMELDRDSPCYNGIVGLVLLILSSLFTFFQLIFMFRNSRVVVKRFKDVSRLGMMHLVATNLCVWIRLVLIEQFVMSEEAHETVLHEMIENNNSFDHMADFPVAAVEFAHAANTCTHRDTWLDRSLVEIQPFFAACVVEYSIIAGAIFFILWRNIDYSGPSEHQQKERPFHFRIDCSASTKGLFSGLACFVFTVVSLIVFYAKSAAGRYAEALWVYVLTDLALYTITIVATGITLYKMRVMRFVPNLERAVMLDGILLFIAVVGQVMFCVFGMVPLAAQSSLTALSVIMLWLRLLQVVLQTLLILAGQRAAVPCDADSKFKPGRDCVTFLLIANIALWVLSSLETPKVASNSMMISFYGEGAWSIIVHCTVPLCVFHRFHSSVCLAEIWKSAYKRKDGGKCEVHHSSEVIDGATSVEMH